MVTFVRFVFLNLVYGHDVQALVIVIGLVDVILIENEDVM